MPLTTHLRVMGAKAIETQIRRGNPQTLGGLLKLCPSDIRDGFASFIYKNSSYNELGVQGALGHQRLSTTGHYLRQHGQIAQRFAEFTRFLELFFEEIQKTGRVDPTILFLRVRLGDITDAQRERLADMRQRTRMGFGCLEPNNPPPEISTTPGPCSVHRCTLCGHGVLFVGSFGPLAVRLAELRHIRSRMSIDRFTSSSFQIEWMMIDALIVTFFKPRAAEFQAASDAHLEKLKSGGAYLFEDSLQPLDRDRTPIMANRDIAQDHISASEWCSTWDRVWTVPWVDIRDLERSWIRDQRGHMENTQKLGERWGETGGASTDNRLRSDAANGMANIRRTLTSCHPPFEEDSGADAGAHCEGRGLCHAATAAINVGSACQVFAGSSENRSSVQGGACTHQFRKPIFARLTPKQMDVVRDENVGFARLVIQRMNGLLESGAFGDWPATDVTVSREKSEPIPPLPDPFTAVVGDAAAWFVEIVGPDLLSCWEQVRAIESTPGGRRRVADVQKYRKEFLQTWQGRRSVPVSRSSMPR